MKRRGRKFYFLPISIASLISLLYLVLSFPPTYQFQIADFKLQILYPALILLFSFLYFLFSFLFANNRRGLFVGLFATIYLILRLNNLTHPLFLILLLILFISLELFYLNRK
ncbi:MAG: hypothetical protein A2171_01270 [Candidatus Levybacteria bacterium RBG_13_35_9]|nr:MAG: hypothetical protein A2171_01270 [Candidatus Levybacteria bacterium RBG_13_35_9]